MPEVRYRDEAGEVHIEEPVSALPIRTEEAPFQASPGVTKEPPRVLRVYAYGVGKNRLRQAAKNLHLPVELTETVRNADVVMTLKNYYRRRPQPISEAERKGVPIHVLRSNTVSQMEGSLADIFGLDMADMDPLAIALRETERAINRVLSGQKSVDLSPRNSYVRRLQHEMARQANLVSHSYGKDPRRHVRIFATQRH
jgi:hypothetical protein